MSDGYTPLNDFRYERKFVASALNNGQVAMMIRRNTAAFREIYVPRKVNNIYFDTPGLDCFYDNLFGIGKRWKARIRWYDSSLKNVNKPILEFKIKNGHAGTKKSWKLNSFELNGDFKNKSTLRNCINESNLPEDVRSKLLALQPVLINNYNRSYFLSADKRFRLTVDTNLAYCDFASINKKVVKLDEERGKIVIELKYSDRFYNDAEVITNSFPFRLDKNSKFVSGMKIIRPGVAE